MTQLSPGVSRESHQSVNPVWAKKMVDYRKEEGPDAECVRRRFRQFRYQEAEGPREACSRLRELCWQWLQPEKHSKEQIVELLVLEQFLAVLPPQIQTRVREGSPGSCGRAVALAEQFLQQQQQQQHQGEDGWEGQVRILVNQLQV
uniref:SCAN box domain-containing protein n=1 Tax=Varanus komodoensis TaxID=61221 RepID=A0A8D2LAS6_VARKO